ncbi:MAG: sulfur-oxidizing protein SoxY [Planctomycetota bacterium]|jgi:sulfur-oxidizing protein SoxY
MKQKRREFLMTAAWTGASLSAIGIGLLTPQRVLAAYKQDAFTTKDATMALKAATGSSEYSESGDIKLKAPDIAENGAVVPITVSSTLPNVESISILATSNPFPMTSTYQLSGMSEPYVSTRIKLGKSTDVIAVVKSNGKLYSASKEVKVTIGGCGG